MQLWHGAGQPWDHHDKIESNIRKHAGEIDGPIAALMADLKQRGMFEDTLISALEQYRREWDDDKKAFRASPLHDWSSHPSDAFRYMSLAWRPAPLRIVKVPKREGFYIPPPDEDRGRFKGIRL